MIRTVSIAEFGSAVQELATGRRSLNVSASIGIAMWMFVCIDCLLSVKGSGLPSVSGSLLLRAYQESVSGALESGDESARLALYGKPYTGWMFWAVIGSQCAAVLFGGLFLLASTPARWASEWLRPPRNPKVRLGVTAACVAAVAAIAWATAHLWHGILVVPDAPDANTEVLSTSALTTFAMIAFIAGAIVSAAMLPARMQHLRFIWWSVAVSLVLAILGVMASRLLLLGETPFRVTDRPFDVFRAIEALIALPIVAALLLWLSFERCGRLVCATFVIVPSPEDRLRMNVTHDQGVRSGLPRFFVRIPKDKNADFCGFLVVDEHPRTIAAPLEYNESIEFSQGRLGFLHLAKSASYSIPLSVVPTTGGLEFSGNLAVTVSDTPIQSSRGVRMPAAGGRECFDWDLIQRIFRGLGGVDQTYTQAVVSNLLRGILQADAGDVLRSMANASLSVASSRAGAAQAGLEAALSAAAPAANAAGPAIAAPTMYGPSPAGTAIALAQVAELRAAITTLANDCRTARDRIDAQVTRIQNEFDRQFFDYLVANVQGRDRGMATASAIGPEDVGKQLLEATVEAIRRMVEIQGVLRTNAHAILNEVMQSAQAVQAEIASIAAPVQANAMESSSQYQKMINDGALERIRQQAARLASVMQALSTTSGFQASTVEEFREGMSAVVQEASGVPPRGERRSPPAAEEQAKNSAAWR